MLCDAHCHFFSNRFFQTLAREKGLQGSEDSVTELTRLLEWEHPQSPQHLAQRWVEELDRNAVSRAALIASVPGDADSVAVAVSAYPERFAGFFMVNPTLTDEGNRVGEALTGGKLRCICLFPSMHRYSLRDPRVVEVLEAADAARAAAVFVHCGVLSVGVRKKLGLPSRFDIRQADPLELHFLAGSFPNLAFIIPHFGAGFFREALMVADLCPNIYLDTSSSNAWIKYHPGLTLEEVFRQSIEVAGARRLLFGSDSSFFPRGWQRPVWERQVEVLKKIGVSAHDQELVMGGNFNRLLPPV